MAIGYAIGYAIGHTDACAISHTSARADIATNGTHTPIPDTDSPATPGIAANFDG